MQNDYQLTVGAMRGRLRTCYPNQEVVTLERDGPVLRFFGFAGRGFVLYRDLGGLEGAALDDLIARQVRVFAELYRKTRQLEQINLELEQRVSSRTSELQASTLQLQESEERRSLALIAGNMGSWDWNRQTADCLWDDGQYRIFGVNRSNFAVTPENIRLRKVFLDPNDRKRFAKQAAEA